MKLWPAAIVYCLSILIFFSTCKKEQKKATPVYYNVPGTWVLTGYKSTYIDTVDVTSAQYPCLSQSKITFNANGTLISTYTGDSVCYINPPGPVRTSLGHPKSVADTGTWELSGNILSERYPTAVKPFYGILSMVNGKLQLTIKDTLNFSGGPYYVTDTEVKQ